MTVAMPFNGDSFIRNKIAELIDRYNIKTIVETGTYKGDTTIELVKMVENVITIELNHTYLSQAKNKFNGVNNVKTYSGNSPEILQKNIASFKQPILFYLDAHWNQYNPLLDELKAIRYNNIKNCVIVIHDFKVPGKDFGFDRYNGRDYEWNLIKDSIEAIYGIDNFDYYYNEKAEGSYRGVIYIVPETEEVGNEN